MADVRQHPGYHAGFFDAADFAPLFEGECSPEYVRAGKRRPDLMGLRPVDDPQPAAPYRRTKRAS